MAVMDYVNNIGVLKQIFIRVSKPTKREEGNWTLELDNTDGLVKNDLHFSFHLHSRGLFSDPSRVSPTSVTTSLPSPHMAVCGFQGGKGHRNPRVPRGGHDPGEGRESGKLEPHTQCSTPPVLFSAILHIFVLRVLSQLLFLRQVSH